MEIQNEIQELTLSFFKVINSEITEDNGLYKITIPEKYHNYFGKSQISITFDEKIAEQQNCELIIPGSKTLFQIITNCNNKGPITIKQSKTGNGSSLIRYHFYVNFSGTSHSSQLFCIGIDLQTQKPVEITEQLEEGDFSINEKLIPEKITPSFNIALEELKQKSSDMKTQFIDKVKSSFQNDFKLFISRYDSEIRELDDSINKKEESSNNFEEIKKFRFETLDKIKKLEKDKSALIDTLHEKHKVILDYNLVACEIISI